MKTTKYQKGLLKNRRHYCTTSETTGNKQRPTDTTGDHCKALDTRGDPLKPLKTTTKRQKLPTICKDHWRLEEAAGNQQRPQGTTRNLQRPLKYTGHLLDQ